MATAVVAALSESIKSSLLQWFDCRVDEAMSLVLRYLFLDTRWKYDIVVDRMDTLRQRRVYSTVRDIAIDQISGFLFLLRLRGEVDVLSEWGQKLWSFRYEVPKSHLTVHAGLKKLLLTGPLSKGITVVDAAGKLVDWWPTDGRWELGKCLVGGDGITYVADDRSCVIRRLDVRGAAIGIDLWPSYRIQTFALIGETHIAIKHVGSIAVYRTSDLSFVRRAKVDNGWRQILFDGSSFIGAQLTDIGVDRRLSRYSSVGMAHQPLPSHTGMSLGIESGCRHKRSDGLDFTFIWDACGVRAIESSDLALPISIF